MAVLRPTTGLPVRLLAHHAIGRASTSDLHVDDPLCSTHHATITWNGSAWELRDLNSRNGTWVDGHRLKTGRGVQLEADMRLAFGNPPVTWHVTDVEPATAAAVDPAGRDHFAQRGLLPLPNEDRPEHTVFRSEDGRWHVESPDQAPRVCKREENLWLDGQPWRLVTPTGRQTTHELEVRRPLDGAALTFLVSPDEEDVAVNALFGGVATRLEPRAHSYLLLTLARQRLADRERGLDPADEGWMERDALAEALRVDLAELSVQVYRARKQFATSGVEGASRLVERRSPGGCLRLGLFEIQVLRVDPHARRT
jgi:hypothetical protein